MRERAEQTGDVAHEVVNRTLASQYSPVPDYFRDEIADFVSASVGAGFYAGGNLIGTAITGWSTLPAGVEDTGNLLGEGAAQLIIASEYQDVESGVVTLSVGAVSAAGLLLMGRGPYSSSSMRGMLRQRYGTNAVTQRVDVSRILDDPGHIWGSSADEIASAFRAAGYEATVRQSSRGSGRAVNIDIGGHEITRIQVHSGGGRHQGAYYNISRNTQNVRGRTSRYRVIDEDFVGEIDNNTNVTRVDQE